MTFCGMVKVYPYDILRLGKMTHDILRLGKDIVGLASAALAAVVEQSLLSRD